MAVYMDGKESYKGQVIKIDTHMWMDGMEDEFAVVWDMDEHNTKRIQVGYYGSDGRNLMDGYAKADMSVEVKKDILRTLKKEAKADFANSVVKYKREIRKGSNVEVIRGRKVKKGTRLEVFWVGDKETYRSKQYSWMHETEKIAGCYDENGEKVWIKAEYLKVIDKIESPNAYQRNQYIKESVRKMYINLVR